MRTFPAETDVKRQRQRQVPHQDAEHMLVGAALGEVLALVRLLIHVHGVVSKWRLGLLFPGLFVEVVVFGLNSNVNFNFYKLSQRPFQVITIKSFFNLI